MATQNSILANKIASILISIALAVCGFFLKQTYDRMSIIENRIYAVELNQATTSGNRFSSVDWQTNKAILDADRLALDKRVTILEENTKNIHQLLLEIKADLKSLQIQKENKL